MYSMYHSIVNNVIGNPATGDDFFDREEVIGLMVEKLYAGNNLVQPAPRRTGKTSVALKVGDELARNGWLFAFVNAEADRDELGFLQNVLEKLKSAGLKLPVMARLNEAVMSVRRKTTGKFGAWGMQIELPPADDGAATLEQLLDRLFQEIETQDRKLLVAVDELPVFLGKLEKEEDGLARVRAFLDWFRKTRTGWRKNVRWLLLGSIGLDTFLERRNLVPEANDLLPIPLGAFSEETALRFLQRLGQDHRCGPEQQPCRVSMSDEVCREIVQTLGWPLPHHLQLVFHTLLGFLGRPPRSPTPADARAAIQHLLQPEYHGQFETWRGRLKEALGPDELKAAYAVLNALCVRPEGVPRPGLLQEVVTCFPQRDSFDRERLLSSVLGQLFRDGYLARQDPPPESAEPARYAFRSFLLREYWRNREVA